MEINIAQQVDYIAQEKNNTSILLIVQQYFALNFDL